MAIEHVNRRGDTYYLHEGKTRTGKPKFFFSRKREGTLAEIIPADYEIYENPNAQVFLRKIPPKLVTDEEIATVERGMHEYAKGEYFLLDVKEESIVVYLTNANIGFLEELASRFGRTPDPGLVREMAKGCSYSPMMRFTLVDEQTRTFAVSRWCFRGAIDGWISLLGGAGQLKKLVAKYCRHLGQESFYELI